MENTTNRKAYKIIPCQLFEVDKLIPWLEEQARNGLILERLSNWGWGRFQKGEPKSLRYWVHTEPDGVPLEQDTLTSYQELGWNRVGQDFPQRFHIFVSEEAAAVPLKLEKDGLQTYIQKQNRQSIFVLMAFVFLIPFCMYWMFDTINGVWQHGWYGKAVGILQGVVYVWLLARGMEYAVSVRRINRLFQLDLLVVLHWKPVKRTASCQILWWIFFAILLYCIVILAVGIFLLNR